MRIVDASEIRAAEAAAVAAGIPEYVLMKRAGEAAANMVSRLMRKFGFSRIVFLCGGGNNAGDALVTASQLHGVFPMRIWSVRPLDALHGAAAEAVTEMPRELRADSAFWPEDPKLQCGDLIVDGLLGIGLKGEVRTEIAGVISKVNASGLPVLSLDVPSGMDSDSGEGRCPGGEALRARWTLTFGLPKKGLFSLSGINFSGVLHTADIGLGEFVPETSCDLEAYTVTDAYRALPVFAADTHKNRRGRLLVMAGSRQYPGAAALAAQAALRGGAGLVRAIRPAGCAPAFPDAVIPMELPAGRDGGFVIAPDWRKLPPVDALTAGPGWGGGVSIEVLRAVLDFPGKLLLDADALNLLSMHPEIWRIRPETVLTPHPGEAERLRRAFGIGDAPDRIQLASELAKRTGAVVVLKGARTAVASPDGRCSLNTSGSADLATAGSGDVLSGIIGALMSSGMTCRDAACLGVFIHGAAGELCGRGCIADDLPPASAKVMAELENRTFL